VNAVLTLIAPIASEQVEAAIASRYQLGILTAG
jgi:hypothetical protein